MSPVFLKRPIYRYVGYAHQSIAREKRETRQETSSPNHTLQYFALLWRKHVATGAWRSRVMAIVREGNIRSSCNGKAD
jgi:hypothetical protein